MRIVDAPPPELPPGSRCIGTCEASAGAQGFAQVLQELFDPVGRGAGQAAAIQPEIGSIPRRFDQTPLLLLTALREDTQDLTAGELLRSDGFGLPDLAQEHPGLAPRNSSAAITRQSLSAEFQYLDQGTNAGSYHFDIGTRSMAQLGRSATVASAAQITDPVAAAVTSRCVPVSGAAPNLAPSAKHPAQPATKYLAPLAPRLPMQLTNEYTAPRQLSPFWAQLRAGEGGLRLVIRAPTLTTEERARLDLRIAGLFAEAGMAAPVTTIHEAGSFRSGEND